MNKSKLAIAGILYMLFTLPAQAAQLLPNIAGGIQFLKYPALAIQRQDVHISLEQVNVNYIFINNSALDLIETMVFTVPNAGYDQQYNPDEEQLQRYTLVANGRNIDYKTMVKPISFTGEDLTTFLSSLGISANPTAAMAQINGEYNSFAVAKRALTQRGLIDQNTNTAKWLTKTYYYWQQKFPPAEEVQIQQTYKPNITTHHHTAHKKPETEQQWKNIFPWKNKANCAKNNHTKAHTQAHTAQEPSAAMAEFAASSAKYTEYLNQYCPNKTDYATLMHNFSQPKHNQQQIISRELNFNLTYDHGWSSPIEHFTLKIEQPNNTMALLCWPEPLQRINATTLIYEARHYVPLRDAHILYATL